MLGSIFVPTPSEINNWSTLDTLPIVETAPTSVPLSVFIRYPCESTLQRVLSLKANGLPATETIGIIQHISENIKEVDIFLADFYSKRGVSRPLYSYLEKLKTERRIESNPPEFMTENAKTMARTLLSPQIEFLQKVNMRSQEISTDIANVFKNNDIWENGKYCDLLIDQICILIYKITALEQLLLSKTDIINDIAGLLKLTKDQELSDSVQGLRVWILTKKAITTIILNNMKEIPEKAFKKLFAFLKDYVRKKIEDDDFIYPDMQYVYFNMFTFLLRFYEQQLNEETKKLQGTKKPKHVLKGVDDDTKNFMKVLEETYPCMLLCFECASDFKFNIPDGYDVVPAKASISNKPKLNALPLNLLLRKIRDLYSELSDTISAALISEPTPEKSQIMCQRIVSSLHTAATILNTVRQMMCKTLAKPPPAPETEEGQKMTHFELSMKIGLKDDLNMFLLVLCICRSVKEIIISNLPLIQKSVNYYIQWYLQNYAYNKLPSSSLRSAKCPPLKGIFEMVRALIGRFNDADFVIRQENQRKYGKLTPTVPSCAPHLSVLELVRVQLQNLINPGNTFMTKKSVLGSVDLSSDDKKEIETFLEDTKNFGELLVLPETIDIVFDQSNLFFKEFYLGLHKVSFFPVTTSLPVILSDFALKNYHKPELTNALFFPLSIYDDAASTALRYLHSKYLYEEIKAEANICLTAITRRISDSAFHPIRKFATVRAFNKNMFKSASSKNQQQDHQQQQQQMEENSLQSCLSENVSAIRIGVLLQQNQLFLLGSPVDTKTLIAERINTLIYESIQQVIDLMDKHGVLVAIAVNKLLEILKSTHSLLHDFGLPIMPFEDTLQLVISTDTPNSLQSRVLLSVSDHLSNTVLFDYYLQTNPFRLIPRVQPKINFQDLHVSNIGSAMQAILMPTASLITVENFREVFWLLDDGAVIILHNQILMEMGEIFQSFIETYSSIQKRLIRMQNAPISSNSIEVFDNFEGAYRYFVHDPEILELFGVMAQLGNLIAVSEMMDDAFALKRSATEQISAFVMNNSPSSLKKDSNNSTANSFGQNELTSIFDREFQSRNKSFETYGILPNENEVIQPFMFSVLKQFASFLRSNISLFVETSDYLLDIKSLKGFTAMWSVLEFLIILRESVQETTENDVYASFGDGVQLCAAAIICQVNQIPLYEILSIGIRVKSHMENDFNLVKEPRIKKFVAVFNKYHAAFRSALASYKPIFDFILNR